MFGFNVNEYFGYGFASIWELFLDFDLAFVECFFFDSNAEKAFVNNMTHIIMKIIFPFI